MGPTYTGLTGTLPELREREARLRSYAASLGITYVIAEWGGRRTEADTNQLVAWRDQAVEAAKRKARANGKSVADIEKAGKAAYYRVAPYGRGYHPYGAAFDIKITTPGKAKTIDNAYKTLGEYAPKIGLRWGGKFPPPADPFHFELAIGLTEAQTRFAAWLRATAGTPAATVAQQVKTAVAKTAAGVKNDPGGIVPALLVVLLGLAALRLTGRA